jgi:hypothetical protein
MKLISIFNVIIDKNLEKNNYYFLIVHLCLGEGIENLLFVVYSRKLIRKMTANGAKFSQMQKKKS